LPNTVYGQPIRTLGSALSSLLNTDAESGPFWLVTRPLYLVAVWLSRLLSLPVSQPGNPHPLMLVLVWGALIAFGLVVAQTSAQRFNQLADRYALLPWAVGCLMHALSYKASGYLHVKYWYWIGEMLLILLTCAILVALLLERLEKQERVQAFVGWLAKGIALVIWLLFSIGLVRDFPLNGGVEPLYDIEGPIH